MGDVVVASDNPGQVVAGGVGHSQRLKFPLPPGFDPTNASHVTKVNRRLREQLGEEWKLDRIEVSDGVAWAIRQIKVAQVTFDADSGRKRIDLPSDTKKTDGERIAAIHEANNPGMALVDFDAFHKVAWLEEMDADTYRCRGAVATALGVKPWLVGITATPMGGWDLVLPDVYVPSRHDDRLFEVATEIIGGLGWQFVSDPKALTARIVPGTPPSFPAMIPYPFDGLVSDEPVRDGSWAAIPLGQQLDGAPWVTDFEANPHMLIAGLTGGGKGQLMTALIAGALARGWELVILDAVKDGIDFVAFEPFCRPGGWGCESLTECVTAVSVAYEEGQRRKKLVKAAGVTKWTELPGDVGLSPIMVIVDEVTSLLSLEPIPKGLPKDHPMLLEVQGRNVLRQMAYQRLAAIARELRFVGVACVASTQVASQKTGLPPEFRTNLQAKVLLGASPTPSNRNLVLDSPADVPDVPAYIARDADGAARGVGVFSFAGQKPAVVKGFFTDPRLVPEWLLGQGIEKCDHPRPTVEQTRQYARISGDVPTVNIEPDPNSGVQGSVSAEFESLISVCESCGTPIDPLSGTCLCTK